MLNHWTCIWMLGATLVWKKLQIYNVYVYIYIYIYIYACMLSYPNKRCEHCFSLVLSASLLSTCSGLFFHVFHDVSCYVSRTFFVYAFHLCPMWLLFFVNVYFDGSHIFDLKRRLRVGKLETHPSVLFFLFVMFTGPFVWRFSHNNCLRVSRPKGQHKTWRKTLTAFLLDNSQIFMYLSLYLSLSVSICKYTLCISRASLIMNSCRSTLTGGHMAPKLAANYHIAIPRPPFSGRGRETWFASNYISSGTE